MSNKLKLLIDGEDLLYNPILLFDLSKDPAERSDVARSNPAVVTRLRAKLTAWAKDVGPPPR